MTQNDGMRVKQPKQEDEQIRRLLVPRPESNDQLLGIVNQHYDIPKPSIVKRLDSYDDANYLLEDAEGNKYLLKIHNGYESRELIKALEGVNDFYTPGRMTSAIHLQNAMMELCYEHGLCTSRPIPTKQLPSGCGVHRRASPVCVAELPVISPEHSPCELVLRLLHWVPGIPMLNIVHLPLEALADAGRYLGKMDRILDNINAAALSGALRHVGSSAALLGQRRKSAPASGGSPINASFASQTQSGYLIANSPTSRKRHKSFGQFEVDTALEERESAILDESLLIPANRFHAWDTKNTANLRKYLVYIEDSKRRGMVESVIQAFEESIIQSGVAESFRKGLNHGDFNEANILMDEKMSVCGAIDFGDSVMSWRVLDVAVAMAYSMLSSYGKQNRSLSAAAGVLRGYNSVYALNENEREHLPLLMACRLSCSVTLGAYAFHMNPTNKYLLLHAEPAWMTLEMLWGYDEPSRVKLADAARRLFDQACLYNDPREKIITCYDLVIPDPSVADLLASVRVMSIETTEPTKKRRRTKGEGMIPVVTVLSKEDKHFREVQRLLRPEAIHDYKQSLLEYHLEARDTGSLHTGDDFIAVARRQCAAAADEIGGAVICEVTGLCLNALNGLPGSSTYAFLEACGINGVIKMISAFEDKSAYARTVVCFSPGPDCESVFFDGRTNGIIVEPRGDGGFGFDSIFQPGLSGGKTYAEMNVEEKDSISHRARAFSQLYDYLHKFRDEVMSQL